MSDENGELKLTEREIAICEGRDPDAPVEEDTDESLDGEERAPPTEGEGEGVREDAEPASWISEDVKEQAASHGLTDEDLASFESEGEFRRAAALLDRQALKKPAAKAEAKAETKTEAAADATDLDESLYAEYGDEVKGLVKFTKAIRTEVAGLKAELAAARENYDRDTVSREWDAWHDAVDELDGRRFGSSTDGDGNPVSVAGKQGDNRKAVIELAQELGLAAVARARQAGEEPRVPTKRVLVRRAEQVLFGEEIRKQEQKQMQERIAEQSRRRRGVSRGGTVTPAKENRNRDVDVANHPDIVKLYDQFQEENGAK